MPPPPPKLSEAGQHLVLALVMGGVLAGSSTLAHLQSRSRHRQIHPDLNEILIDAFRVGRPASWQTLGPSPPADAPLERRFVEPGAGGRVLELTEWTGAGVASPQLALGQLAQRGPGPVFRLNRLQAVRFGSLSGIVAQAVPVAADGLAETGILGVLTLDGRTYLGVRLTTGLPQPRGSAELVGRILESARNESYQPVRTPVRLTRSIELNVPAGLRAFRANEATRPGTVLVTPLGRAPFGLLQLSIRSLADTPKPAEGSDVPQPLQALLRADSPADPDQRLAAWLLWRHWRATGAVAPPDARQRSTVAGRAVLGTALDSPAGADLQAAIWATRISDREGIFIDMVGTAAAWGNGRRPQEAGGRPAPLPAAARELLANLVVSSDDRSETDDDQGPSPDTNTDAPTSAPLSPGNARPSDEP